MSAQSLGASIHESLFFHPTVVLEEEEGQNNIYHPNLKQPQSTRLPDAKGWCPRLTGLKYGPPREMTRHDWGNAEN
jgi:hypothetical protein